MSTVVNLRAARKRKQRDAKEKAAADNRVRFGRSKQERDRADAEQNRAERELDGNRRDPAGNPGNGGSKDGP